jgi:glycosyltransferase involved in cell wall biosynthesis
MVVQNPSYPLVSIIIPAYNHEAYINRCLNSILLDNYPNKEILIIDDGSADNTQSRIVNWISKNHESIQISYSKNYKNRGVCYTLNNLITRTKGEFLVLLGSDDYLLNNGIISRLNYLATNENKKAVIGDCIVIDDHDNLIFESSLSELHNANIKNYFTDESLKREIIWNWSVTGPALMVKKDIYDYIGNYDSRLKIEDWDFYLRMVSKNLLGFIDQKVCAYRLHSANYCRSKINERMVSIELFKSAIKNLHNFHGTTRRLLTRKALVYLYMIFISKLNEGRSGTSKPTHSV